MDNVENAYNSSWAIAAIISFFVFIFVWFVETFTPKSNAENVKKNIEADEENTEKSGYLTTMRGIKNIKKINAGTCTPPRDH